MTNAQLDSFRAIVQRVSSEDLPTLGQSSTRLQELDAELRSIFPTDPDYSSAREQLRKILVGREAKTRGKALLTQAVQALRASRPDTDSVRQLAEAMYLLHNVKYF